MGAIYNNQPLGMPMINGKKHNAYINVGGTAKTVWPYTAPPIGGPWVTTTLSIGRYYFFGMGQDGCLYATGPTSGSGVMRLQSTGSWYTTNIPTWSGSCFGRTSGGVLYVGSAGEGIKVLTSSGVWGNTSLNAGMVTSMQLGPDNVLYASGNGGCYYLSSGTSWTVSSGITGGGYLGTVDNTMYTATGMSIYRLVSTGNWAVCTLTSSSNQSPYGPFAVGQNGVLYCLDNNGRGIIKRDSVSAWSMTNITSGRWNSFGMGPNNILYVGSDSNSGIYQLNSSGSWVPTNWSTGRVKSFGLGQDGIFYAGTYSPNYEILALGSDGNWGVSSKPASAPAYSTIYGFGMGQDNKLYGGTVSEGIWMLDK